MNALTEYFFYFFNGFEQAVSLLSVLIVFFGLVVLGGVLGGRNRLSAADAICGWALVSLLFTVAGVLTSLPFTYVFWSTAILAVGSAVYIYRRDGRIGALGLVRVLTLMLPLLLIISSMQASQWDEFSHWLSSTRFLLDTDGFPWSGNPITGGSFPAYPYGWPLLGYLSGNVAGHFIENFGGLFNVLLLLTFGLAMLRVVEKGLGVQEPLKRSWAVCALAALMVTLLNPTFVQKVVLTVYADTSTAVVLGFGALIGWMMLESLATGSQRETRQLSWQFGLAMLVLVNIKPVNAIHMVLLVAGLLLATLRDPKISLMDFSRQLPVMVLPGMIIYGLWKFHVIMELPLQSELSFRPISEWFFHLIPQVLWMMLVVAGKKSVFFVIMGVASVLGVISLFNFKGSFDRLSILIGTVFIGYNLFLMVAYIGVFGENDALRVSSYWRYNMHLGMLSVLFAGYGLSLLWRRYQGAQPVPMAFKALALLLLLAAPFVFAKKLRFDLEPHKPHYRMVGSQMLEHLDKGARIVVIDPKGSGESAVITKFELHDRGEFLGYFSAWQSQDKKVIEAYFAQQKPTNLVVHSIVPGFRNAIGIDLNEGQSYLLEADGGGGWGIIRSWPYPDNG